MEITLDNGETRTIDQKNAIKELRKIQAQERKKQAKIDRDSDIAQDRAKITLAEIAIRCCAVLDDNSCMYAKYHTEGGYFRSLNLQTALSSGVLQATIHAAGGTATLRAYNWTIDAVLINGAGFMQAIRGNNGEGPVWYAVGVCEDQLATLQLPKRLGELVEKAHVRYMERKAQ